MSAAGSADAVHQTNALAALTASRAAKEPDSDHTSFGDELTEAQRPAGTSSHPLTRPNREQQHPDRHRDQHPQGRPAPERDVPRHPVLRGRAGGPATSGRNTAVTRRPVPLHPMALDPAATAVAQPPAPTPLPVPPTAASAAPTAAAADPAAAAPPAPAITALVAGSPSAPVAPDRQQPASDAATKALPTDAQQTAAPAAGPVQISVTTSVPAAAPTPAAAAAVPAQPTTALPPTQAPPQQAQVQQPSPTADPTPAQAAAVAVTVATVAQPPGQHHGAALPGQPDPAQSTSQPAGTVSAAAGRPTTDQQTTDQGPAQQDHNPAPAHNREGSADSAPVGAPATPYSTAADRADLVSPTAAAPTGAPTTQEVPATQALPPGTLAQVNSAEHSVRVQVETQTLGKVTAEMHTRPGEIGVHLSVPDDAGRALMAQRLDALRDSLGQSGSAVHLSLAARGDSPHGEPGNPFQGQQSGTPREDRAPAQSAHLPHDAATPRATDGSPMTPAPADGTRLVDVHA